MSDNEEQEMSIEELDQYIEDRRTRLIELNSERVKLVRGAVYSIEKLRFRFNEEMEELSQAFNENVDEISEAMALGSRMVSDLTADLLMDEFNIEEIEDTESEESDE